MRIMLSLSRQPFSIFRRYQSVLSILLANEVVEFHLVIPISVKLFERLSFIDHLATTSW